MNKVAVVEQWIASLQSELVNIYDTASVSSSSLIPSSSVQITPRLTTFTCGHVIPPSIVVTSCLSLGPTSQKLDFRHFSRSSNVLMSLVGQYWICAVLSQWALLYFCQKLQIRYNNLISQIDVEGTLHAASRQYKSQQQTASLQNKNDERGRRDRRRSSLRSRSGSAIVIAIVMSIHKWRV